MVRAVGFDRHIDACPFRRYLQHSAMVEHFENIPAPFADGGGDSSKYPGPVVDEDANGDNTLLARKLAHHDRRGKARVDIAAGEDQADALAGKPVRIGK